MSAVKRALEDCAEKLLADQGIPVSDDLYFEVWDAVMAGYLTPVDFDGEYWVLGNMIFASTDKELLHVADRVA